MSAMAFAAYALYQVTEGNLEEGHRYADISLTVHDHFGALEYLPRVLVACHSLVFPWKRPYDLCLEPLLYCRKLGHQTGDLDSACQAANVYCCLSLETGKRLDDLLGEWTAFQKSMAMSGQDAYLRMSLAPAKVIRRLMGIEDDSYDFEEAAGLTKRIGATKANVSLRMWQMRLAYLFNDYRLASKCALLEEFYGMPGAFLVPCMLYVGALVCLQAMRDGREKRDNQKMAKEILGRFRKWSLACPENCSGRRLLIEAEMASIEDRQEEAYEHFVCAIALFRDKPGDHALANERLARHLLAVEERDRAMPYLLASVASYMAWGAIGKASRLEEEFGLTKPSPKSQ